MKKRITFLLAIQFLIACSGDGGGETPINPTPTEINTAPSVPVLKTPENNLSCIDVTQTFSWEASTDPDNDPVRYKFLIAKDQNFQQEIKELSLNESGQELVLEPGFIYYWKVKAVDTKNNESEFSETFKFFTNPGNPLNKLPYLAINVFPDNDDEIETTSQVELQWTCEDPDSDPLTYDIYFGKNESPELLKSNVTETSFSVSVEVATEYYWQIVAKDTHGGKSLGNIWSFKVK